MCLSLPVTGPKENKHGSHEPPDGGSSRGPCPECTKALPTHNRLLSGPEKKKKSNWEGQPMGPGTAAFLGRLAEWVVVVMLRG